MATHDFEQTLLELPEQYTPFVCAGYLQAKRETIQLALRIADRLQRGGVSDGMTKAGCAVMMAEMDEICADIFEAMAQQLIKECENED